MEGKIGKLYRENIQWIECKDICTGNMTRNAGSAAVRNWESSGGDRLWFGRNDGKKDLCERQEQEQQINNS